jgi:hypothetical protein
VAAGAWGLLLAHVLDLVGKVADSVAPVAGRWLLAAQVRTASGIPLAVRAAEHLREQDEIQAARSAVRGVLQTLMVAGIPSVGRAAARREERLVARRVEVSPTPQVLDSIAPLLLSDTQTSQLPGPAADSEARAWDGLDSATRDLVQEVRSVDRLAALNSGTEGLAVLETALGADSDAGVVDSAASDGDSVWGSA